MSTASLSVDAHGPRVRTGYVVDARQDACWFLALPFAAVLTALWAQQRLPEVALAAVGMLVTVPHHFATWLRVYGSPVEFAQWRERLVWGPVLLVGTAFLLIEYAPLTLVLVVFLWDHQHSIMQQYGFSRVYDFKAGTGAPTTPRFDFYLNWVLFGNMVIVSPLFSIYWVRLLHELHLPIGAVAALGVMRVSWTLSALYLVAYAIHVARSIRSGYALNPVKYLFLLSSYFLWYFTSFHTSYLLVWAVAHRLMHGLQYIVMVYHYNRNHVQRHGGDSPLLAYLGGVERGHVVAFLALCGAYAGAFYTLTESRGFGTDSDLFLYSLVSSFGLVHYYFDSFIWKVRRRNVQENL